jgi:hypothetical protein
VSSHHVSGVSIPADRAHISSEMKVAPLQVEHVKARCLPGGLNYPMLEEYDFKNDRINPHLPIELKPSVEHRPFQARCVLLNHSADQRHSISASWTKRLALCSMNSAVQRDEWCCRRGR